MNDLNVHISLSVSYHSFELIQSRNNPAIIYPILINYKNGKINDEVYSASPFHGRSVVVNFSDNLYTIIKGSGLNYFPYQFINTGEMGDNSWGLLLKEDAKRDYEIGNYISSKGILTNEMEAIIEITDTTFKIKKTSINPILLQYTVKCPYRLCDAAFMNQNQIKSFTSRWNEYDFEDSGLYHIMAANKLLFNLNKLHSNSILHNAISIQNYTFLLELLDFETARTPMNPFLSERDEKIATKLYNREFLQTFEIIYYISFLFKEKLNDKILKSLVEKYALTKYLNKSK
jgi:hypothetical protein